MKVPQYPGKHKHKALFDPKDLINWHKNTKNGVPDLPSDYIICYYPYVENYFKKKYATKNNKLWRLVNIHHNGAVGLVRITGIGSPNAATVIEELIALGAKRIINIGSAGGLEDFGVFLCERALRDEGTSHHYFPSGKYMEPDKGLTKKLERTLIQYGIDYERSSTWTIDAPYRETKKEIIHYRKKGIKTVEMEASALFAVARYRKVKIAACFVVSDIVGSDKWDPQFDKRHVQQKLKGLVDVAVDCFVQ